MKVVIKPYANWWGPHQIADKFLPFLDDDKRERVGYFLSDVSKKLKINKISDFFYKRADKKRISVRIDRYDTWNMDYTLSHIILPMLKQLNETKHGAPYVDDEDVPEHLRSTAAPAKENDWDTDDNHFKRWDRWDWVLEELIWTFTQIKEDNWESQYYKDLGEIDFDSSKEDDTISWKRKPVIDWEGRNKHQERITNGLKLFGKYYQALWD